MTADRPDDPDQVAHTDSADLAVRLARERHDHTPDPGMPRWSELDERQRSDRIRWAQRYLDAAAAAGLAIAAVDDRDLSTPRRLTAMVRGTDGQPLERDEYAESLRVELELHGGRAGGDALAERQLRLSDGQAGVAAALLDELAGVYRDEDLGRLAREVAVILYDRLGL